jgi:hypothetical protein
VWKLLRKIIEGVKKMLTAKGVAIDTTAAVTKNSTANVEKVTSNNAAVTVWEISPIEPGTDLSWARVVNNQLHVWFGEPWFITGQGQAAYSTNGVSFKDGIFSGYASITFVLHGEYTGVANINWWMLAIAIKVLEGGLSLSGHIDSAAYRTTDGTLASLSKTVTGAVAYDTDTQKFSGSSVAVVGTIRGKYDIFRIQATADGGIQFSQVREHSNSSGSGANWVTSNKTLYLKNNIWTTRG